MSVIFPDDDPDFEIDDDELDVWLSEIRKQDLLDRAKKIQENSVLKDVLNNQQEMER